MEHTPIGETSMLLHKFTGAVVSRTIDRSYSQRPGTRPRLAYAVAFRARRVFQSD